VTPTSLKNTVELMSAERMQRTLQRIAYQIFEITGNDPNIVLLGIDKRGFSLAKRLSLYLSKIINSPVDTFKLGINDQTDDTRNISTLEGRNVVLVDDVIFTGRTVYQALHKLFDRGEPSHLMLAVLIDRGHRTYPVEAQYVGLRIPSKLNEHVRVQLSELEQPDQVLLELSK